MNHRSLNSQQPSPCEPPGSLNFASNFRRGISVWTRSLVLCEQPETRSVRPTCFCCALASLRNNQVSRPSRFSREEPRRHRCWFTCKHTVTHGSLWRSPPLLLCFALRLSRSRRRTATQEAAEHRNGHGSTRRERDPAGGRLENPRCDYQEENAGGYDVCCGLYLPPRLVTSSSTLLLRAEHIWVLFTPEHPDTVTPEEGV